MYKSLANKRVVITGGASGIGLATVKRFIDEGAKVFVLDRDERALGELRKLPGVAGALLCDVSSHTQVTEAFRKIRDVAGGVDVLIANAGISVRNKFVDITPEQWNKVLGVNLNGVFYCAQNAVSCMNEGGVILMAASTNGITGHPNYADYNASKAGLILLAKTMALELAPRIRVNAICPGYVLTPMQLAEYSPEAIEEVNRSIPLGRHATPEEIAGLYAFLSSSEGAYVTGQSIVIDGGELA